MRFFSRLSPCTCLLSCICIGVRSKRNNQSNTNIHTQNTNISKQRLSVLLCNYTKRCLLLKTVLLVLLPASTWTLTNPKINLLLPIGSRHLFSYQFCDQPGSLCQGSGWTVCQPCAVYCTSWTVITVSAATVCLCVLCKLVFKLTKSMRKQYTC